MPRKMLGIKIFNEINGPNQSVFSFGALFIPAAQADVGSRRQKRAAAHKIAHKRSRPCPATQVAGAMRSLLAGLI
jgi:hypothetical protein